MGYQGGMFGWTGDRATAPKSLQGQWKRLGNRGSLPPPQKNLNQTLYSIANFTCQLSDFRISAQFVRIKYTSNMAVFSTADRMT